MDITISLLAYGEAENLKILLPRIKKAISAVTDSYEVRIIDGAVSKDNTKEVCRRISGGLCKSGITLLWWCI